MSRHLALLVCSLGLWGSPALAESVRWGDASVVIAGVLEWQDSDYDDFEKRGRQDKVLAEAFRKLGVPGERLEVLLDRKAKHGAILESVARLAAATPAGGTFVFYFDGHGVRLEDGRVAFASSDVRSGKEESTALVLDALGDAIARSFRGRRVILLADCCHAGGLAAVAQVLRRRGLEAISLTSSEASNSSTGDWTYTLALVDALHGRALLDRDRSGFIELDELNVEVREAMQYRDLQRSGFDAMAASQRLVLAPARKEPAPRAPRGFRVGDYARTADDEVVRILGERERQAIVESLDYATREVTELDVSELSPIRFQTFEPGAELKVVWEEKCWDARVVKRDGAFHLITYPGWDHFWDEWVADDRIISTGESCPDQ